MEQTEEKKITSLRELRGQGKPPRDFSKKMRKWFPFLFNIRSLFYFGVLVFLTGVLWMAGSLIVNSGTQIYGWDYQIQYLTFTYDYYDIWHEFFRTGHFTLYSTSTYLGTDNIGSNAYYGLFDPFSFICYIFPRSWIPQTFAFATLFKGVASAFALRAYTRYLGVSETGSRLGGLAYAFCGYVCFFAGFPTFVSMTFAVPMILLGIEKVLREQKPLVLCIGLALMGMILFFFLVVVCIFGALYAIWRYFATIKTRTVKMNFATIGVGVAGFALGIMLCAWVLLPSVRESSLSGRTTSIGMAYLNSLINAFKDQDFVTICARLFEMVGDSPVRELQGLISFFYPTCNYIYLPLTQSGYDSWTSSLFCWTPIVILFFIGIFSAIRREKWSHLLAFFICGYLVFTNFAYFFFYAFTGDGYGRWYIVLVPLIIYYAMAEFDRLKEEKPWVILSGSLFTLALAAFTWVFVSNYVPGKTFIIAEPGTYWQTTYTVPATIYTMGVSRNLGWLVYYQLILYAVVGGAYIIFRKKDWLKYVIGASIIIETAVAGNLSYIYGSSYSYELYYNGGASTASTLTGIWDDINAQDSSYFRGHTDGLADKNTQQAFGYNDTSTFHSLFNYDVVQLTRYSHMTDNERTGTKYGSTYTTKSWSGYYGNKRWDFDTSLGLKYYVVKNEGYGSSLSEGGCEPHLYGADNVPFGSELVKDYGTYRVYRNTLIDDMALGHAVDHIYKANSDPTTGNPARDDFYSDIYNTREVMRNEEVYTSGAIVLDSDVEKLENEGLDLSWEEAPSTSDTRMSAVTCSRAVYTNDYNWWGPSLESGGHAGPTYFLTDPETEISTTIPSIINSDTQKLVLTPRYKEDGYFNEDPTGAYFLINYNIDDYTDSTRYSKITRIYFIGDTFNDDGTIKEENVLLSYEYHTIRDFARKKVGYGGYLFGFYCKGRVKYICFCGKNSDGSTRAVDTETQVYMCERSVLEEEANKLKSTEYNLYDVKFSTDQFTFKSSFSTKRLVTTFLGYDAGWSVTATDSSGNTYKPNTYKLDGGFLGFVAPEGEISYTLTYHTPYLDLGVGLSLVAVFTLIIYESARWAYKRKKKRSQGETSTNELVKQDVIDIDEEEPTS